MRSILLTDTLNISLNQSFNQCYPLIDFTHFYIIFVYKYCVYEYVFKTENKLRWKRLLGIYTASHIMFGNL